MARTALVTGVSRRSGIGFAIVRRLLREPGAKVFAHSYAPYDATEPWGADPGGIAGVLADLGGEGECLVHLAVDLSDPAVPGRLVQAAVERFGSLDALVVNHARSQLGTLAELEAASLDATWAVNVRASLLLVQAFAEQYRPGAGGGRVMLFTSGQHLGPMPAEIPYAVTKGALQQITRTLADALADRDITVNCLNPGPTGTRPQHRVGRTRPGAPAGAGAAGARPAHCQLREVNLPDAKVGAGVDRTPVGDLAGVGEQLPGAGPARAGHPGQLLGELGHLFAGFQVALGVDPVDVPRVEGDETPGGVEHVGGRGIAAVGVAHEVGQHRRLADILGEAQHPGRLSRRARAAVVDDLDEKVERPGDGTPAVEVGAGEVRTAGRERPTDLGTRAQQDEQPRGMLGDEVEPAHRLAALAQAFANFTAP